MLDQRYTNIDSIYCVCWAAWRQCHGFDTLRNIQTHNNSRSRYSKEAERAGKNIYHDFKLSKTLLSMVYIIYLSTLTINEEFFKLWYWLFVLMVWSGEHMQYLGGNEMSFSPHLVSLKDECRSGVWTRDLRHSKQAILTTAPALPWWNQPYSHRLNSGLVKAINWSRIPLFLTSPKYIFPARYTCC